MVLLLLAGICITPSGFGFSIRLSEAIVFCLSVTAGVRLTVITTGATSGISVFREQSTINRRRASAVGAAELPLPVNPEPER